MEDVRKYKDFYIKIKSASNLIVDILDNINDKASIECVTENYHNFIRHCVIEVEEVEE